MRVRTRVEIITRTCVSKVRSQLSQQGKKLFQGEKTKGPGGYTLGDGGRFGLVLCASLRSLYEALGSAWDLLEGIVG